MPPDSPGTLTDQQTLDAIAHMFAVSNMPAGEKELPLDLKALASIMIEAQPKWPKPVMGQALGVRIMCDG